MKQARLSPLDGTRRLDGRSPVGGQLESAKTLFSVLAAYFLFNMALRLIMPHGLELDEAEQTNFSQWLLAGYSSQPPLYNWLQYAVFQIFGTSLASLSGLKNALLFSSYVFYYLAARQVVADKRLAIVAALGLLTIPQVAFEAQRDLSHTVAAIFGASLFAYALLRTLSAPSFVAFILFGIATGVGGITKYNFILLPAAALLAILCDRDLRPKLLDWRLLISGVIALAIVTPHALWLRDNFAATSSHTMQKLVGGDGNPFIAILEGLGTLGLSAIGFLALTFVIFAICYREHVKTLIRAENRWTRFIGRVLIFSLALIVLMVLFAGVERVRDRWLTPILILGPLYLTLKVDAAKIPLLPGLKRIWITAGIIMVLVPAILFGRIATSRYTHDYEYINIPFQAVSREVASRMAGADSVVLTSDGQLAGNIRLNLPQATVLTTKAPTGMQPVSLTSYQRIVFAWRDRDGSTPATFEAEFADYLRERGITATSPSVAIVSYPYVWGNVGDQYAFGIAVMDLPR
ncbi:ArnT family glycosyltransferase [Neorhizobium alkalisoli]|uniref:4-amino-4-deoxy-L-arabinose transferase-like glycosyltransferase n=1 Tax=Neorhizobium alkalisoli TaxID=528178 RepID=A0A561R2U3_9HYPH|nr:glycosyltransferase family 39 protein [Neorhizobium alkalisoli]TWF56945.1 4-amino-4-deoxy-L-arabinose transferase-like glycosyltransferase [Neorhizobium alkalisoli]